ncbi:MAG: hypothetical protein EP335_19005 [Alphaproteobacteria bacterium]|nr:MAG: hypothetical protein EP335_19005 [Alphaproteobacteria bacterium]
MSLPRLIAMLMLGLAAAMPVAAQDHRFAIQEGRGDNAFIEAGPVAGHLMLTSGTHPRLIAAFPAGNSGAGLFFEGGDRSVTWQRTSDLEPVILADPDGIGLAGFMLDVSLDTNRLTVARGDVGSLRFIRGAVDMNAVAPRPEIAPALDGQKATWQRDRADGKSRYRLTVEVLNGSATAGEGGQVVFETKAASLSLRITALTGDTPLTPITGESLLTEQAVDAPRLENALGFLSYEQKLLAGSWRFLTYFGRDTLLTVELLMPVLGRDAVEAGLGSVIERVNAAGEVAHEEEIGELAVLHNLQSEGRAADTPIYDYAMVDDNLMLLPVLARYINGLSDTDAIAFLRRTRADGHSYGSVVADNAAFVLNAARPFAADPVAKNLISLKPGQVHGNWRDSEEGLAGGRYPYDVNTVLMPAALDAIAALRTRGLLAGAAGDAHALAAFWQREAVKHFIVSVPADDAAARVQAYGAQQAVPVEAALASLGTGPVAFDALALDASGNAVPVQQSDPGFGLLFTAPAPEVLDRALASAERPFPAGLMSPVGLFVANPVFADADTQGLVGPGNYHGTVVWSWQQAMWVAGIRRQMARTDLDAGLKARLKAVECRLWQAIDATADIRNSELWSWSYRDGRYAVAPFGQSAGHLTESNAVQLWSTVYLGLPHPAAGMCNK